MDIKELLEDDLENQSVFLIKLLAIVNNKLREKKDRDISIESDVLLASSVVESISAKLKILAEM